MCEIPDFLVQQVKEHKAVLFLGAGASREAIDGNGNHPPTGQELARKLSERFLGGRHATLPLDQVGEYAISESNLLAVQEHIREIFEPFAPTEAHKLIPGFCWEGIATTNYDKLIETAYEAAVRPLQKPQPFIDDGDQIQERMRDPNSIKLLKLHGCITRTNNPQYPLILTIDQYSQYEQRRRRLFNQLYEWAFEHVIVFIGYSLNDPDLRKLLLKIAENAGERRPRYYAVAPGIDAIQTRFWEGKKITCINASFSGFMKTLDRSISSTFRGLKVDFSKLTHPLEERFSVGGSSLSERCRRFLEVEVEYVKECIRQPLVKPRDFYRGFDLGWAGVEQGLDVNRRLADEILSDMVLDNPSKSSNGPTITLIRAHAGAGKSTLLRRIAWDATHDYDKLCLFLQPHGLIDLQSIAEIQNRVQERIFLFVDNAGNHVGEFRSLVNAKSPELRHVTVIAAERTNQWNMVSEEAKTCIAQHYELRYLSEKEIDQLLALLRKHKALGTLESCSEAQQKDAFQARAGRQILVALHEATLGKRFEEIVVDEYHSLASEEAKNIYLTICVLNRLGVGVRAGIISRIHGIRFEEFKEKLFLPLENVVHAQFNPIIRDYMYSARHPHISQLLFDNILHDQDLRFDAYIRCLQELNTAYQADAFAFHQMVRANVLVEMFVNPDLILNIFKVAGNMEGQTAFLLHQMAIFELRRPSGNLEHSMDLLRMAEQIEPRSASIKHSRAEAELKLAEKASTSLEKEKHLTRAEEIAGSLATRRLLDPHPYHTRCKALLMRIKDALATSGESIPSSLVEKFARDMEELLSRALQQFPDEPHLLDAESQFAGLLSDSERALNALEQAFDGNPRNSWFAIRISRAYLTKGEPAKASEVLRRALEANSNKHELHYAYAKMHLADPSADPNDLLYHLKRSFSPGDSNYDAQLLYGRQLFLDGNIDECKSIFEALKSAKMNPDAKSRLRYPLAQVFQGSISRMEYSYVWIRRDGVGDFVFGHRDNIGDDVWNKLDRDRRVRFRIGFNMWGPSACEVLC